MSEGTIVDLRKLAAKVRQRKNQIKKIMEFVERITVKRGEEVTRDVFSFNTHIVKVLDGFGGFSFYCSTGETEMGGDTIKVWYHPDKKRIETNKIEPVFRVRYQGSDLCENSIFNEGKTWQLALQRVIKNEKKIMAQMERVDGLQKVKDRKFAEKQDKEEKLKEEARKLGMKL